MLGFPLAILYFQSESPSIVKTVRSVSAPVGDRLRVREAAAEGHCSIGMIYVWMKEERFRTWTDKRRNKERGTRYIDAKSFRRWLKEQRKEAV